MSIHMLALSCWLYCLAYCTAMFILSCYVYRVYPGLYLFVLFSLARYKKSPTYSRAHFSGIVLSIMDRLDEQLSLIDCGRRTC